MPLDAVIELEVLLPSEPQVSCGCLGCRGALSGYNHTRPPAEVQVGHSLAELCCPVWGEAGKMKMNAHKHANPTPAEVQVRSGLRACSVQLEGLILSMRVGLGVGPAVTPGSPPSRSRRGQRWRLVWVPVWVPGWA